MMVKPHQLLWVFFFLFYNFVEIYALLPPSLPPVRITFSVLATTESAKRRKKGKKRREGKKGGGRKKSK